MPLYPTYILLLLLLYREVSWCSWLSHHFHVVRVPGSNPGGTIFACLLDTSTYTDLDTTTALPIRPRFTYHTYPSFFYKQKSSGGKFRSTDLQVMSLPRYHCATPLSPSYSPFLYPFPLITRKDKKTPSPGIEPGAQT